jgi:hypothetical protein
LIEQPIGVCSMLAYYSTQYLDRKTDQGASFMRFVGEKVVFPTFLPLCVCKHKCFLYRSTSW